jgi:hypothetical protein
VPVTTAQYIKYLAMLFSVGKRIVDDWWPMTDPDSIIGHSSAGTLLVPSVRSPQSASSRKAL